MSRMYGWKMALVLLCALWAGSVAQAWAEDTVADGRQLVITASYGCAIEQQGRLGCFGYHESALGPAPEGRYLSVSLSSNWSSACAVRSDGEAVCWAKSDASRLTPPPGPWRSLSVGVREACGLRPDGQMVCWGDGGGPVAPPSGPFLALSIASGHGCAIRNDGTLQCWKRYDNDELGAPPAGRFSQVAVSDYHACGLRSDGRVLCWGQAIHGNLDAPVEGGFIDVAVGFHNGCALRADGTAQCWGSRWEWETGYRPMESPQGTFTELASGEFRACGRRPDGLLACWGEAIEGAPRSPLGPPLARIAVGGGEACALDAAGAAHCTGLVAALQPPPGNYARLSLGDASACGLTLDGRTRCWGASLGPAPNVPLSEISVGAAHACGLRFDAGVVCWGDNAARQLEAPPGDYRAVLAGDRYSCALSTEGTVTCWGDDPLVAGVPVGRGFRGLFGSDGVICASRETGASKCWGDGGAWLALVNDTGIPVLAVGDYFACYLLDGGVFCDGDVGRDVPGFGGGGVIAVAAAGDQACTITLLNEIDCSGAQDIERRIETMRIGTGAVGAGATHTCNLASDGVVDCWGSNAFDYHTAPPMRARVLSVEADHACAVTAAGAVQCWGDDSRGGNQPPAGLAARDVDVGQFNGCAVRSDGDAACWGWNVNGQGTPPAGAFRHVATGLNHSCGLRDDNTLACWGYGADGQTAAPAGAFIAVDVGERHSCAIAADGGLRCWGLDTEGEAAPPAGSTYRALSTGAIHNCAIRSDGALTCWGFDDFGQGTPPPGRFVSVSAGTDHSCGVRDDGMRLCWGNAFAGQSPVIGIGPAALPRGEREQAYEARLVVTATSGYVPRGATFRVVSGALPPGIDLDADGLLHGWPQAEGVFDVLIEARDANGLGALRAYRIQIGVPRDTVPPQIEFVATGPVGDNGWFVGDVDIRWLSQSQQSGISYTSGCENFVLDQDTYYRLLECTVGTRGGAARSESGTLKRDATPPRIKTSLRSVIPEAGGWYRTPVEAIYTCEDATSGIALPCPVPDTLSVDGTHVFPIRSTRDNAGNTGTSPGISVRIDMTRPQLSATMPPAQLFVGAVHDFQLSATDALSGIASQSCTPVNTATPTASEPGSAPRVATCTAVDHAGNSTSVSSVYEVVPQARRTGGAGQPVQQNTPASKRVRRVLPQPIQRGVKPRAR
ncbi:MAG: hypothetical protein V4673_15090 [Pseudomonadota bacterium]